MGYRLAATFDEFNVARPTILQAQTIKNALQLCRGLPASRTATHGAGSYMLLKICHLDYGLMSQEDMLHLSGSFSYSWQSVCCRPVGLSL